MRRLTHGTERCGRGALRATALLTLLTALFVAPATAGAATAGGLKQLTNSKGCIVDETPVPAGCVDVRGMAGVSDVVSSPGGSNIYVSSNAKDAIVAFGRDQTTGELTQKASSTGCITSDAATAGPPPGGDGCNLIPNVNALESVTAIAMSPDGDNVYAVTNTGFLTVLDRDDTGTLSFNQLYSGIAAGVASAVTVSPDGGSVYVGGPFYSGIVVQMRRITAAGPTHGQVSFILCWGNGGGCQTAQNFGAPSDLAVTPDNRELLIASSANNTLHGWNRSTADPAAPNLTPATAASRCVSNTTFGGTCQARSGMNEVRTLALADSGTKVYVGSAQSLTTVTRNATSNELAPDTTGNCFGYPGSGFTGCTDMPQNFSSFYQARSIVATPDGKNLYFGTESTNAAIYAFTRGGGSLSLTPTPLGCTITVGGGGCTTFRQGNRIQAMAAPANNRHVYAAGNNRLFTFALDRPPVCQNVSAGTVNTAAVTVTLNCSDPDGDALTYEKVTDPGRGTLAGIQGNTVSYGPQPGTTGVDSFQYRARAAGILADPATASINVTAPPTGGGGGGGGGGTVTTVPSTTSISSLGFKKYTKLLALSVKNLVAGSTVRVTCKTKKKSRQKKGCAYKSKRFTTSGARARLNLRKPFAKKRIPVGTKITITITAPGYLGKQVQYTTRAAKIPKSRVRCLSASGKAGSCA